jgi:hypothetical protein
MLFVDLQGPEEPFFSAEEYTSELMLLTRLLFGTREVENDQEQPSPGQSFIDLRPPPPRGGRWGVNW